MGESGVHFPQEVKLEAGGLSEAESPLEVVGTQLPPPPLLRLKLLQVVEPVLKTLGRAEWLLIHDSSFPAVMWALRGNI